MHKVVTVVLLNKVIDESNSPVPSATIILTDTSYGNISESDGTFELKNIRFGEYEIKVSLKGFQTVEFNSTAPLEVNFKLKEAIGQGDHLYNLKNMLEFNEDYISVAIQPLTTLKR